jgi:hypothetical protein
MTCPANLRRLILMYVKSHQSQITFIIWHYMVCNTDSIITK